MAYETIRYELADAIATVTLARPDRLNAVDGRMIRELIDALDRVDADDAVRAVIVTGDGRAFSAGADLSKGAKTFAPQAATIGASDGLGGEPETVRDAGGILALRLFDMLKPVIGAINGPAIGLGATMTLPMDVRLASETARFGFVFARLGMVPKATSSYFLPRLVGVSRAMRWCTGGRHIGAQEAYAGGLVSEVHPPDALLPAARAIAHEMVADTSAVSVALTRQMLWRGLTLSHPMEAHRIESRGIVERGRAADAGEGVAAFLAKRRPAFPDRVSNDMPSYFPWWTEPGFH